MQIGENFDSELFQFDESETWLKPKRQLKFNLDSELEDEDLDTILIVTQRKRSLSVSPVRDLPELDKTPSKQATSKPIGSQPTTLEQVTDMINEGLYLYENSAGNQRECGLLVEKSLTSSSLPNSNQPQPPALTFSAVPIMDPKRFFQGSNSSSPPVGWLANHKPLLSKSVQVPQKQSIPVQPVNLQKPTRQSKESSSSASLKDFQPFQHPSYELLKVNGFAQQKYSKYHDKAIKGNYILNSKNEKQKG
jgi:hypothetical protein